MMIQIELSNEARKIIRAHAARHDCRYRIQRTGQVDYYGRMPNTNQEGWYFVGWDAAKVAAEIQSGER